MTPQQRVAEADRLAADGRHADAAAILRALLREHPGIAELHFNFGNALKGSGDLAGAARAYRQAASLKPGLAEAHFNLGNTCRDLGRPDEARNAYAAALAQQPGHVGALANLAGLLLDAGEAAAAGTIARRALIIDPDFAPALNTVAMSWDAGKPAGAERWLRRAVALAPGHPAAWSNLGELLRGDGRLEEAERCQRNALALAPGDATLMTNLGIVLSDQHRRSAALTVQTRALALDPALDQALWNLGLLKLSLGDLAEGYDLYDHRFAAGATPSRPVACPRWGGEPLAGRRLLVWREQGVGDEIMWSTCLPDVTEAASCTIECDPRLVGLFARSFPSAVVRPAGAEHPADDADFHIPIGSLPRHVRPSLAAFPSGPALKADPARVAAWRRRLDSLGPGLKIGLSWRSLRGRAGNVARNYTRLSDWQPLIDTPGVRLISLQYDDDPAERGVLGDPGALTVWPDLDLRQDLDEVAALMTALDGVVSVANTVSALAGALGRPVAQLILEHDWAMLGTTRFPWSDSVACLIRPAEAADWSDQIATSARLAAGWQPGGAAG
jgi:Flp pilus assembly protein TadD